MGCTCQQRLSRACQIYKSYYAHKEKIWKTLTRQERQFNYDIAKVRVIAANFFRGMQSLWNITKDTYNWKKEQYDI